MILCHPDFSQHFKLISGSPLQLGLCSTLSLDLLKQFSTINLITPFVARMPDRIKSDIGNAFILLQASERMMQIVKIKLTLTWQGCQFDPPVQQDFFGPSAKCWRKHTKFTTWTLHIRSALFWHEQRVWLLWEWGPFVFVTTKMGHFKPTLELSYPSQSRQLTVILSLFIIEH